MYILIKYKSLLHNMFLELGENMASRYLAIQKIQVKLGDLRQKILKFSGNECCLEFKGWTVLITDEQKGNIYFN